MRRVLCKRRRTRVYIIRSRSRDFRLSRGVIFGHTKKKKIKKLHCDTVMNAFFAISPTTAVLRIPSRLYHRDDLTRVVFIFYKHTHTHVPTYLPKYVYLCTLVHILRLVLRCSVFALDQNVIFYRYVPTSSYYIRPYYTDNLFFFPFL